jgi:Protein of unknown function (DUF3037)
MASKYSIVQYVPNPIADERVNIGVVTFDEDKVCVQFLKNWDRVRHFGTGNINFLKDFAKQMNEAADSGLLFPGDLHDGTPNKQEQLTKVARGWINSIQFTEPRSSLDSAQNLLEDIIQDYLIEPAPEKPIFRDRQAAARLTVSQIKKVLERRLDTEAKKRLKTNSPVRGSHREYDFDAVFANGQPYFAAHGISFEVRVPAEVQNSISWMISDVKKHNPQFLLAIVALPPKAESANRQYLEDIYQKTTSTYSQLGANVLTENQIEPWVEKTLESLSV